MPAEVRFVADRTEFWWNERKPDQPSLWESKIRLGEDLFNEIISHPVPLDMNILKALKRCALGLDLYMWLTYRTFALPRSAAAHLAAVVPPVRLAPGQGQRQAHCSKLSQSSSARVAEDQARLAGVELRDGLRASCLDTGHRAAQSRPARELISPFPVLIGLSGPGWTFWYAGIHPLFESGLGWNDYRSRQGLALALLLYRRSRISGIIAFQSHNVSMIGGDNAVFPDETAVQYRGTPIPRLTSSTVWIWNAGKKTVKGADIVAHDPLRLRFGGEVLDVRIRKVSRKVLRITADTSGEIGETARCEFEFLDPGDGGVLEVLHTGSAEAPECTGTIIGLPEGLRYWGRAWSSFASSRRERRVDQLFFTVMLIMGLGMSVMGILGEQRVEQYIEEALPSLFALISDEPLQPQL